MEALEGPGSSSLEYPEVPSLLPDALGSAYRIEWFPNKYVVEPAGTFRPIFVSSCLDEKLKQNHTGFRSAHC